jgi:hypothetical protein
MVDVNTPIRVGGLLRAFGETLVGGKPLGKFLDGALELLYLFSWDMGHW